MSAPTTVFGNGAAARLIATSGATNFVGGVGPQTLYGGQNANVLTYLAIGDGGDRVDNFDPAKDVIDLSNIDADIFTPGVQTFTFIGDAPFSDGAQVRYQLNPATNTTTVQAGLAGDPMADFTLTLIGLVPLTAANFALTPSQSSADLADAAALSSKKDPVVAGALTEVRIFERSGQSLFVIRSLLCLDLRPCDGRSEPELDRKRACPLRSQSDSHAEAAEANPFRRAD